MATLDDLLAQRDAIIASLGVSKVDYQGRSIEYDTGASLAIKLAILQAQIDKLSNQQTPPTPGSGGMCTLAKFDRG